jgi:hypothetical protein
LFFKNISYISVTNHKSEGKTKFIHQFKQYIMEYLIQSLIGAGGGFLMEKLGKGGPWGTIGNVLSGVVGGNAGGSLLGGALGGLLGQSATGGSGGIGSWLASALGSMVITWVTGFFKK